MPTIASLTERTAPLTPQCRGIDAYNRFAADPNALLLAVVDQDAAIGVVERDAFLLRFAGVNGQAQFANRSVTQVMDPDPVVVEAAVDIAAFCDSMLSGCASALMRGFVVTDQGRYVGVATVLSLLQATSAEARARTVRLGDPLETLDPARTTAETGARDKLRFLSVISHEIRTPLNGVLAVAELLQRQPLGQDSRAYVQTIVDSSEALLRVLEDAVDHARAEAGELDIRPEPTRVREVMDELQSSWIQRARQDGVQLLIGYEGDPDLVAEFDPGRVRQVFSALIGHALSYARNGVVEVRLKAAIGADAVRLEGSVRDNGQKLAPGQLDHIFDPLADPSAQTFGSGLGLPICRQVIEAMGGRIEGTLNRGGKGATFTFAFEAPRAWIEEAGDSNVSALAELDLQEEPHILIVDDNATNRVVAQALCEMFGCTSECAEDGLEAVEAVKSRPFDMVLMDIKMPRMDGVQATLAIRALAGPARDIPIVALTANADPDDAARYLEIGMAAVVEKPIKPERLRAAMNAALEAASAARADHQAMEHRATG